MNWIKKEYIFVYGYFQKFGTKKTKDYSKYIEIFRRIQGREFANARNTFNLKLLNFDSYKRGLLRNHGGLSKNTMFLETIIGNETQIKKKFEVMIQNLNQIDVPSNLEEYKNQKEIIYDISLENENIGKRDAHVSYTGITLKAYLDDVRKGRFKVPLFQRDFAWTKPMIISFLNSLMRGFPFGTITVWKDEDNTFKSFRNEFVEAFRDKENYNIDNNVQWILDGQQRTTSIVSQLAQNVKGRNKHKGIIFSLATNEFKAKDKFDINYIHASDLLNENIGIEELSVKYKMDYKTAAVINRLKKQLLNSHIGVTTVDKSSLNTAIDIFTEMNTTGKRLSLFDIVNAKWLAPEIDYNLERFIKEWLSKEGRVYKPDELTLTKSIYLIFDKNNIKSKDIMKYKIPDNISEKMKSVEKTLDLAHDFLMNEMNFKGELIPSSNLIRFISYAFAMNGNKKFNTDQNIALRKYVKGVCLINMYSSSTDTKLATNVKDVDRILNNRFDFIKDIKLAQKDILAIDYNEGSSSYKYILNVLFRDAKSLENNSNIPVMSSDLASSTINIHHIVPKSIKVQGEKVEKILYGNSLANLAPILEKENQQISKKYPSVYLKEFASTNSQLKNTLENLYIDKGFLLEMDENVEQEFLKDFWEARAIKIAEIVNADI